MNRAASIRPFESPGRLARRIALIVLAGCLGGNAVLWFRTNLTRSTYDFLCAGSLGEVVEATVLYGGGLAIALVLPVTAT